jgi:simple sugar transport system permease protein
MGDLLTAAFAAQVLRISVPYTLAALGATCSERGGVVNIALEGILLVGAFASVVVTWWTGSPWLGVLGAVAAGVLVALLHAAVSVSLGADQIVSGIAINLLAVGATKFMLRVFFGSSSNSERIAGLPEWRVPVLSSIPVIGTVVSSPLLLLSAALVLGGWILLTRTPFGLRLRAVGEHPEAAETLGVNVAATRYAGVLLSGALAALGGAWLAMEQHSFTDGMSGGRGFIALAAMIVGKWHPLGAAAACLLFGLAEALEINLQSLRIPTQFVQMIPYVLTLVVLAGFIGRAVPPAADGIPYRKEEE